MKSPLLLAAAALVLGTVGGLVAGAYFMGRYEASRQQPAPNGLAEASARSQDAPNYEALRQAMAQQVLAAAQPGTPGTPETPAEPPRLSIEEQEKRWRAKFASSIAELKAEPRDPSWAGATEVAFEKDFTEHVGDFEVQLKDIECKASGCLAQVEWDSYDTAVRRYRRIPHHNFTTNCATSIDLGELPAQRSLPHQATVVFNCPRDAR